MDKRLILAVAGSGKTALVIDKLNLDERFLILTYTENNFHNIKNRVFQKFGYIPENIKIFTYFSFLYSFCFKPFLQDQLDVKGINFERCPNKFAQGLDRYIDNGSRVYSNRLVKLIESQNSMGHVVDRLKKYFDMIIIDEVQDFAGHDFNLLNYIATANNKILFVGDFFQHTFDTSSDGAVNKNLHDDLTRYLAKFQNMGLLIDIDTLRHSFRCSPSICRYITKNLGINISSHRKDETTINFIDTESVAKTIFDDNKIVKLFYREHHKYTCHSNNWGNSKGQNDFTDVCVVLNPTTLKHFRENNLSELKSQTKNKLYVAITRARGNLFFIEEKIAKDLLITA